MNRRPPPTHTQITHTHVKCALLRRKLGKGEEVSNVLAKNAANVLSLQLAGNRRAKKGLNAHSHTPAWQHLHLVSIKLHYGKMMDEIAERYTPGKRPDELMEGDVTATHWESENPRAARSRPAGRAGAVGRRTPSSSGLRFI